MKTSEQTDKILPALITARKSIHPAGKSAENKFDRYAYANEEDWHKAVMPSLLANGLCMSCAVDEVVRLEDRTTKNDGTQRCVEVRGHARLHHESGQWMEVTGAGEGHDRGDKAIYIAITGMKKYLYAMMFALPTTDDPEKDDAPPPPPKPKTKAEKEAEFDALSEPEKYARIKAAIEKAKDSKERLQGIGEKLQSQGLTPEHGAELLGLCDQYLGATS